MKAPLKIWVLGHIILLLGAFLKCDNGNVILIGCRPSALRKLHDSVADPKYEGRRTTRQQVVEMDQDVEEDSSQSSLDGGLPSQSDPDGDGSDPGKVEKTSTVLPKKDPEADDLSSTLRQTRDEDRKKGKAVARQIVGLDYVSRDIVGNLAFSGHLGLAPRRQDKAAKVRQHRK